MSTKPEYSVNADGIFNGKPTGFITVQRGDLYCPIHVSWNSKIYEPQRPYIHSQQQAEFVAQIIADALNARAAEIAALDPAAQEVN